jgi:hypothetical protein
MLVNSAFDEIDTIQNIDFNLLETNIKKIKLDNSRTLKFEYKNEDEIQNITIEEDKTFSIDRFSHKDKTYILKEEVLCNRYCEDGYWVYEVEKYNLNAYSEYKNEAFNIINEQFSIFYNKFTNKEDDELTKDAIKLKNCFLNDVKEII